MKNAFTLMVALLLAACGDSKPTALPDGPLDVRIKALSSNITEVNEVVKGEAVMITFFKPSIWDGKNWTWNFLNTAKTVLSRFGEAAKGTPYQRVTFMAHIPTRNNLGQEGQQLAMKVTYRLDKLAGAQWDNMTEFDMGELPDEISFRPLGTEAVLDYCKGNAEYSKRFCSLALASALRR